MAPAESTRNPEELARKIRDLEERLNHIMPESERSRLAIELYNLKMQRKPRSPVLWTPRGEHQTRSSFHEHDCSACGKHFSHDSEESECPEVKGRCFCEICYETAVEHGHRCPVCQDHWTHYAVPDCILPEVAPCFRHGQTAPGLRGLASVAGMDTLKAQLYEQVVSPLRNPEDFNAYRLGIPNGILLFGPPGCGKTYVSRQLAEELGYFYQEVFPSEVGGTYIHETALKIRDVFARAADHAPSVLFIDEFEGLVPRRAGLDSPYKAEEVNEFLKQIESCATRRILLIAASNEPWRIDVAIQRTGRLDIKVLVGPPDIAARTAMLKFHLHGRPVDAGIDASTFAKTLVGYSASDLKFLVDQAARIALRSRSPIKTEHLWEAVKTVPASISIEDEERYKTFRERGAH